MSSKRNSNRKRSRPVEAESTIKKFKKNKSAMFLAVFIVLMMVLGSFYVIFAGNNTGNDENSSDAQSSIAMIDTSMGDIKIKLYTEKAPITAKNFIDLAKSGYYDGLTFHRVIPDFMIQGGDPNGDGTGGHAAEYHEGYGDPNNPNTWVIPDEFHPDLSNIRGTLSMANSGPNTGGSQFFINIKDNSYLDYNKEPTEYKHAVFGEVLEGMDIVDSISQVQTDSNDEPIEDVTINSIEMIEE